MIKITLRKKQMELKKKITLLKKEIFERIEAALNMRINFV